MLCYSLESLTKPLALLGADFHDLQDALDVLAKRPLRGSGGSLRQRELADQETDRDLRLLEPGLAAFLRSAGFTGFAIISRLDVYAGAPQHSSAAKFGTLRITFRARKPVPGEEEEPTQCALP